MKVLVSLVVLMAFGQVVYSMNLRSPEWDTFKNQYLKSYGNVAEEKSRMKTYTENKKMIAEHNAKYNKGLVSYELTLNQFADLSSDEFVKVYTRFRLPGSAANLLAANLNASASLKAPNAIDWRQKGAVTGVKNQESCGSCWAFSAIGALEGQHFRKHGVLVPLSEQNLVDCSSKYGNHGCNGGLMNNAFEYIKDNKGVNTGKSYPYEGQQMRCRFNSKNIGATLTGYKNIPKGDEGSLKEAVGNVGPVAVAIDGNPKSFQFYSKGVYNEPACSESRLTHAVLAVGYGTDQRGGDFWLVKNSWGTSWGEGGYIKMARNRNNQCGIATIASYPIV